MATAATVAPERLLTIEEYLALPPCAEPTELVRGRIVVLNPPYPWHGYVCGRATVLLSRFIDEHQLGSVLTNDSGVVTERDPDSLRGADVAYYSFERAPRELLKQRGYLSVVPDLIMEVKSPSELWKDILAKVADYLIAGVSVVCVLDPERSAITVYQPDRPEETLAAGQTLTLPAVLPGFAVAVERFFE